MGHFFLVGKFEAKLASSGIVATASGVGTSSRTDGKKLLTWVGGRFMTCFPSRERLLIRLLLCVFLGRKFHA